MQAWHQIPCQDTVAESEVHRMRDEIKLFVDSDLQKVLKFLKMDYLYRGISAKKKNVTLYCDQSQQQCIQSKRTIVTSHVSKHCKRTRGLVKHTS